MMGSIFGQHSFPVRHNRLFDCLTAFLTSHHHTHSQSPTPFFTIPIATNIHHFSLISSYGKAYRQNLHLPITPPAVVGLAFPRSICVQANWSTTTALIAMLQAISDMLNSHPYMRLFALDFSKAFDKNAVRHSTLLEKLAKLNLPDEAYDWLKDFFDDHSHCTRFTGNTSPL